MYLGAASALLTDNSPAESSPAQNSPAGVSVLEVSTTSNRGADIGGYGFTQFNSGEPAYGDPKWKNPWPGGPGVYRYAIRDSNPEPAD